jgi:hypothetical protein
MRSSCNVYFLLLSRIFIEHGRIKASSNESQKQEHLLFRWNASKSRSSPSQYEGDCITTTVERYECLNL